MWCHSCCGGVMKSGAMLLPLLIPLLSLVGVGQACVDPEEAYRFTGAVCRLTYPAALVCE